MSDTYSAPRRRLYRDTGHGKIGGVCAGLAAYFGFEVWVVRIITVTLLIFMGPPIFIAYFVMMFILDKKPANGDEGLTAGASAGPGYSAGGHAEQTYQPDPLTVWRSGTGPQQILDQVEATFGKLEQRLRVLEGFVTSSRFQWEKQFKEINR